MPNDEQDKAGVIGPPPLIYLGALVFGLLLGKRFPMRFLPRTMARGLGWPLLGGGVLLLGWFEQAMRQADTPSNPYKPVERIATEGPFRYTRNPGYLAIALIYAGIASLANALWAVLLLPVALLVIQRGVIERALSRGIGESLTLDFKEMLGRRRGLARDVCTLANTQGGVLVVGVKDQKLEDSPPKDPWGFRGSAR